MKSIAKSVEYLTKYAYGGECSQEAAKHIIKLLAEYDFIATKQCQCTSADGTVPKCGT